MPHRNIDDDDDQYTLPAGKYEEHRNTSSTSLSGDDLPDVEAPPKSHAVFFLGCFFLIIVCGLWTLSSVLVQTLIDEYYNKPIFITYCSTSVFATYIPIFYGINFFRTFVNQIKLKKLLRDANPNSRYGESLVAAGAGFCQRYDPTETSSLIPSSSSINGSSDESSSNNNHPHKVNLNNKKDPLQHLNKFEIEAVPGTPIYSCLQTLQILKNERGLKVFSHTIRNSIGLAVTWLFMNMTYNVALKHVTVSMNSILSTTSSAFVLLIGVVLFCNPLRKLHALMVVITMLGAFFVTYIGAPAEDTTTQHTLLDNIIGPALSLFSAFLYGLYSVVVEALFDGERPYHEQKSFILKQREMVEAAERNEQLMTPQTLARFHAFANINDSNQGNNHNSDHVVNIHLDSPNNMVGRKGTSPAFGSINTENHKHITPQQQQQQQHSRQQHHPGSTTLSHAQKEGENDIEGEDQTLGLLIGNTNYTTFIVNVDQQTNQIDVERITECIIDDTILEQQHSQLQSQTNTGQQQEQTSSTLLLSKNNITPPPPQQQSNINIVNDDDNNTNLSSDEQSQLETAFTTALLDIDPSLRPVVPINLNEDEPKLAVGLLFGCIGVVNLFLGIPLLAFMHYTGIETWEAPPARAYGILVLNSFLGASVSDFLFAQSVAMTSPIIATLTIPLTIPMAMLSDLWLHAIPINFWSVLGSILIVFSTSTVAIDQYKTEQSYDQRLRAFLKQRKEELILDYQQQRKKQQQQKQLLPQE